MITEIVIGIVLLMGSTLMGSLMYRIKKLENQVEEKIGKTEVRELIKDKLDLCSYQIDTVKEDVEKLIVKIDILLNLPR